MQMYTPSTTAMLNWCSVLLLSSLAAGCSKDDGSGVADGMKSDSGITDSATGDGGDASAAMDAGDASAAMDAGDESDAGNDPCGVTLGGADSPLFEQTSSRFNITTLPEAVILEGAVYDGPLVEFHRESQRQGACRLLTYTATLCTPACEGAAVCVDSQCVEYPTVLPVGPTRLSGVGEDVTVEANGINAYFWYTESVRGDSVSRVTVSAPGDVGPSFNLTTCAVSAPQPASDWDALLNQRALGESVTLTWSNPIEGARIYLRMVTGVGTHGGVSHTEIECEGLDTGSLTLPGSYLDALYSQGWSCGECGGNKLFRYHATEAISDNITIQLRLRASVDFWHLPSTR